MSRPHRRPARPENAVKTLRTIPRRPPRFRSPAVVREALRRGRLPEPGADRPPRTKPSPKSLRVSPVGPGPARRHPDRRRRTPTPRRPGSQARLWKSGWCRTWQQRPPEREQQREREHQQQRERREPRRSLAAATSRQLQEPAGIGSRWPPWRHRGGDLTVIISMSPRMRNDAGGGRKFRARLRRSFI